MSAYSVILSEEALVQLKKLDNPTAGRLLAKLEESAADPQHFFERLAGREEYKLRVGDFRIIAHLLHSDKSVFVVSIGHRKNIYKNR